VRTRGTPGRLTGAFTEKGEVFMIQELSNNEVFSNEYRNIAPKAGDLAAVFEKNGRNLLMRLDAEGAMSLPEAVLLIDSWKDQASLDVHHASPMMQTIMQLREKYDLHMRAERYTQENEAVSAADASFIRK
jgi:hypothetical protein